ncbi:hypothetical protein PHET_10044 [Paragonimus heterotremus]|uniref:Tubulin/FtsZ GTPase domain-containing protein n=1 Tax=Paragonimus heterotremus TaxID=100268 RepID=A0A8J4T2J4_9TREM|nr:hypothetical protein PHET_10044 [Paragonimus heterotremus]
MEPKSISRILRNSQLNLHFRKSNIIFGRTGCGSNWAFGYFGRSEISSVAEESLNGVRRESERLDRCLGLCLMHGLAGGTGSGLGLRLVEDTADELGLGLRLTFSVMPHRFGDAPLQSYNCLLSLARLTQLSDTVVLLHNDWLLAQLQPITRTVGRDLLSTTVENHDDNGVTIEQMNQLAATQMTSLLNPSTASPDGDQLNVQPLAISHSLTALPEAKLIRLVSESSRQLPANTEQG